MENVNDLKGLKEEVKVYEREVLSMLLEVSQSFSDENYPKEKREELFSKIDSLREKVKDIAKIIEEVENRKYDFAYENLEEKDNDFKLDNIKVVEKEEVIEESIKENIINEKENEAETENIEENTIDVIEEDLSNIDEAIENMEKRDGKIKDTNEAYNIKDEIDEEKASKDGESDVIESNIQELTFEDAIGKIDMLIKEAKEINNNVIKFPEDKVVRRNGFRDYEEEKENNDYISYEEEVSRRRKKIISEENKLEKRSASKDVYEKENLKNMDNVENFEPVPVLFGNNRAQNQMIVRKKSNGFSDKLKSLIFKIKTMLGGENEQEK